ncbi:MAG: phosphoserine phosphatase SerB [Actinobacteria bacterium]|nr:phosphoserine phosphatase SerB [Actinomycetota bacterium]MSY82097.1 phosphoserine phosphatase SerB [Actinomycetota bacterium]MSZ45813.1 phosphoserine phosphatase SerB [Actinomycetota bacterium]
MLSGEDSPGVTAALFSTLSPFQISVLDIEQVVIRGRLVLTVLISLDPAHCSAIEEDLLAMAAASSLDLAIDFQDSPVEAVALPTRLHIVVLSTELKPTGIAGVAAKISEFNGNIDRIHRTASYPLTAIELDASFPSGNIELNTIARELAEVAQRENLDISVERAGLMRRAKRIVLLDMDSTLIREEVIDLLARKAGVEESVAAITQSAMRGELDFSQSLAARVQQLAGLAESAIAEVAREITLTPGARTLIKTLHRLGHKVGVVSGGFLNVIEPLLQELQIDFYQANTLEIQNGHLTGKTVGPIIDRAAKADALREFAQRENVALSQTVAIGDGANDLDMIEAAGLGIAFNAKPAVQAAADSAVNSPYLDSVLYLIGISRDEIEASD